MIADFPTWLTAAFALATVLHFLLVDIPGLCRHGLAYCKTSETKDR